MVSFIHKFKNQKPTSSGRTVTPSWWAIYVCSDGKMPGSWLSKETISSVS